MAGDTAQRIAHISLSIHASCSSAFGWMANSSWWIVCPNSGYRSRWCHQREINSTSNFLTGWFWEAMLWGGAGWLTRRYMFFFFHNISKTLRPQILQEIEKLLRAPEEYGLKNMSLIPDIMMVANCDMTILELRWLIIWSLQVRNDFYAALQTNLDKITRDYLANVEREMRFDISHPE